MEKLKALTPEKLEYYQKVLDSAQTIWDAKAEIDGTMGDDMQLGLALFAYKEILQHLNTRPQPEVLTEGWIIEEDLQGYKARKWDTLDVSFAEEEAKAWASEEIPCIAIPVKIIKEMKEE